MKKRMKTLAIIVVCSLSVLVILLLLVPIGVNYQVHGYPNAGYTVMGKARVGDITVENNGWFTQNVAVPEITSCVGDQEVPLDSWIVAGSSVVKGTGQVANIRLKPGEKGTIYLIASDATINEKMQLYQRASHFSCLDPGTRLG